MIIYSETPGGLIIVWLSCANCSYIACCVADKDLKAAATSAISDWGAPDWNLALHLQAAEEAVVSLVPYVNTIELE